MLYVYVSSTSMCKERWKIGQRIKLLRAQNPLFSFLNRKRIEKTPLEHKRNEKIAIGSRTHLKNSQTKKKKKRKKRKSQTSVIVATNCSSRK